jgi:hypothetical protein
MKSFIFCYITPCRLLKVIRRFGGIYLHLQSRRISQTRNQREVNIKQSLLFDIEDGVYMFFRNVRCNQGIKSKYVVFIYKTT